MKQWVIQFVSGTTWRIRAQGLGIPRDGAYWRVERLDLIVVVADKPEYKSMGFWLVNMDNVEAVKET